MAKRVTMQMIADALGITKVSVSKALGDQPGVSDALRARVVEKARSMGYATQGRSGAGSIKHLAFLEPRKYFLESGDFFSQVYYHLLQICTSRKINLHLHVVGEEEEEALTLPFSFEQYSMDGIFLGGELRRDYLSMLRRCEIPTVAIGFYEIHNAIDAVVVDDYYNSNQITNGLVEMGHKELGFLGDRKCAHSAMDRYYGFLKALEENDLVFHKEWLISDVDEHGRNTTEYQLPKRLPTAFLCHSDFAAHNLRLKLKETSPSAGKDVALATFDDTELARSSGAVIMLDISGEKFAATAMRQMLWRCKNSTAEHQRITINAPVILPAGGAAR